ncbi:syntaxin [Obba rivulosa]|uniref:Syntaxin n=1 Tax=Obba rivulosa TaxID=1052685 RepID=A0A8E2J745_9APHY|nr:syntaxin [Obba rivulosa]
MSAMQAVFVRGYEERTEPKPHIVYRIEVQASVRSWQMWRRYSEFADLHVELTKSTGVPPPAPLPPKHSLSLFRSKSDPVLLEERRAGLEQYLRAIVAAHDDRWRDNPAFREFLGVPVGRASMGPALAAPSGTGGPPAFSATSWMDEHAELAARMRDVRAEINRRDALADRGDVAGAHQANVQAKKTLAGVLTRATALVAGLPALGQAGMSDGELQRRADMAARLRDDCEKLAKMVTVARLTSRGLGTAAERNPASQSDRAALLESGSRSEGFARPGRVFGAKPQETEATRPLDDHGLLQLQQTQIEQQDDQLAQFTTILQRQKHLGLAIHQEISEQNELLDDLTNEVDRVGGKLTSAKRQMNRLG